VTSGFTLARMKVEFDQFVAPPPECRDGKAALFYVNDDADKRSPIVVGITRDCGVTPQHLVESVPGLVESKVGRDEMCLRSLPTTDSGCPKWVIRSNDRILIG
jgi:hypothetical protein